MGIDELIAVLWRRRATFAIVTAIAFAVVVVVTVAVPKTYDSTATIFVGQSIEGDLASQTLDSTQGEQLARTFTTLAADPQVAELAGARLADPLSRTEIAERVAISPVERTQLLEISGEAGSPEEAAELANAYAAVFVNQMGRLHAEGRVPTTVALSARAIPPTDASKPNVPLYIGFGAVLSVFLGLGVALARNRFDRRVPLDPDEDSLLGESILGRLPSASSSLVVPIDRRPAGEPLADAMRVLRTNVELAPGERARTIVVSSADSGEGKTTVASELALTIADDGDSVVLVELDLRRPTLDLSGPGTRLVRDERGMAEVLAGRIEITDAVQKSVDLPGLAVAYSGGLAAAPSRLLRSDRLAAALGELRGRYSWVIVDAPPLLVADDVLLIAHQVDGCLLVIDAERTPLPAIRSAIGRLHKVGARILGLVVNRSEPEPGGPYYGSRTHRGGDDGKRSEGDRRRDRRRRRVRS